VVSRCSDSEWNRASAPGRGFSVSSAVAENALDVVTSNPIDLRDLGDRHAVLHPASDACEGEHGMSRVVCAGTAGVSGSACRIGAGGEIIASTRGLRPGWLSAAGVSETDDVPTGGFDVNSASAAWRALAIRSRSSPRGGRCCCRLSKISSQGSDPTSISKSDLVAFGKDLRSRCRAAQVRATQARNRVRPHKVRNVELADLNYETNVIRRRWLFPRIGLAVLVNVFTTLTIRTRMRQMILRPKAAIAVAVVVGALLASPASLAGA